MPSIEVKFLPRDRCVIAATKEFSRVIRINHGGESTMYLVPYYVHGVRYEAWFDPFELDAVVEEKRGSIAVFTRAGAAFDGAEDPKPGPG